MNRIVSKTWRDSASLIVLNKRSGDSLSRSRGALVNYEVLLQTRTSKASFPNSVVFPGGVTEAADASADWLSLFSSFGYTQHDFDALHHAGGAVRPIFQPDPVRRHIALRITAIRETFEELGLLLCCREHKSKRNNLWSSAIADIDIKDWQDRVSKNPDELLNLCKEYNCYPDIWALHYWSNWLSPVHLPKRFNTAFFVAAFQSEPPNIESNSEVISVQWSNPVDVLARNNNKELELYPPQVYELNRLIHLTDIEELIKFAQKRSCHSNAVIFPVVIKASDGILHLLPGDDLYPTNVDYTNGNDKTIKDNTVLDLRNSSNILHRFEIIHSESRGQFVIQKYKPSNHINMGDKTIRVQMTIHKSK
ncbi:nucleoside diphosphate-linked moiety X motif 19-like [Ostrinia furnacalis]|uniref:nucleoside diphosphate-linked moiety X motif 19-like n=1 Tax=Ostrinia furnacalis TaxID=93504 RepID=UPI00103A6DAA|nr:nucleoside diphosphate-linked moiety X motif 19-like [Ostrinia furnacalis]